MLCVVDGDSYREAITPQTGTLEQFDGRSNELMWGVAKTTADAAVETEFAD